MSPMTLMLLHLGVPAALTVWLFFQRFGSKLTAYAVLVLVANGFAFLMLVGSWHVFGVWTRLVLIALFVVACFICIGRLRDLSWHPQGFGMILTIGAVGGVSLFLIGWTEVFGARNVPLSGMELSFPLRGGTFYVTQGGAVELMNQHHGVVATRYGLDFVEINAAGMRGKGFFPSELADYTVYGHPILAPCTGKVAAVVDGRPDHPPNDVGDDQPMGNHILFHCDGATVLVAHLQSKSIQVRAGAKVKRGDPIAKVGNSGKSSEPHLYLQADKGLHSDAEKLMKATDPLPILFAGRFFVRNDRVDAPNQ